MSASESYARLAIVGMMGESTELLKEIQYRATVRVAPRLGTVRMILGRRRPPDETAATCAA